MKLIVRDFRYHQKGQEYTIDIDENDHIKDLMKKITEKIRITSIFILMYEGQVINWKSDADETISSYGFEDADIIELLQSSRGGGYIDNILDENDNNIGFNTKYLDRHELFINLIYFDLSITNSENYEYLNDFKIDVVGGFHAIDDIDILKNYLEKIKEKNIPFIVISSGKSANEVIPLCKKYRVIKEVIIFCKNYNYNEHYIKEYPGYVKQVFTCIFLLYEYLKSFGQNNFKDGLEKYKYSSDDIKMDKQIKQCPVITSKEYRCCYFLIHLAYSHFFGDINNINEKPTFDNNNVNKIKECMNKIKDINENEKKNLIEKFIDLTKTKDNNTFVEKCINYYTKEGNFCYLFNRIMRFFESGLISFAYYMGPFLFGINKYIKENPDFGFSKDMTLYRKLTLSDIEFHSYKLNLGHIICFPSLTSTSSKEIDFKPTGLAQSLCGNNSEKRINIKMIFKYKHKNGNISPGIILEDKKGHDNKYLSDCPSEYEVLLLPFTFAKINDIKSGNKNINIIEMEIVNRPSYIEYDYQNHMFYHDYLE